VPVEAALTLSATSACAAGETPEFQFSSQRVGTDATWQIIRPYSAVSSVTVPAGGRPSGRYRFMVEVRRAGATGRDSYRAEYVLVGDVCHGLTLPEQSKDTFSNPLIIDPQATCTGGTPEFQIRYEALNVAPALLEPAWAPGPRAWDTSALPSGRYSVTVRVRSAGNTSDAEESIGNRTYFIGATCSHASLVHPPGELQLGTVVPVAASARCISSAVPEYRFEYRLKGATEFQLLRDWGAAIASWNTAQTGLRSGIYEVRVLTRAHGNASAEAADSAEFRLGSVCTQASLTASPELPQVPPLSVRLQAAAHCSFDGVPLYKFVRVNASGSVTLRDWAPESSLDWTPTTVADGGTLAVHVRAQGNATLPYESSASREYTLLSPTSQSACVGTAGASTFCSGCSCAAGQGHCMSGQQCAAGLVCASSNGRQFGFSTKTNVCVPSHCTNQRQDADETGVDCGGLDCGTCVVACDSTFPNQGRPGFCNDCACGVGQGDCDTTAECAPGLLCTTNVGPSFGTDVAIDVCLPRHCSNRLRDPALGEEGIDCGGPCGTCLSACTGPAGGGEYCLGCRCGIGQGDCESDSDCLPGLRCLTNAGGRFGFSAATDVCVPPHCTNDYHDTLLGETAVDCGGECGPCPSECPPGSPGGAEFCQGCACSRGQGDCDFDRECAAGHLCVANAGLEFGFSAGTDVCLPDRSTTTSVGDTCAPRNAPHEAVPVCAASTLSLLGHEGFTRALWAGEEYPETGKRAQPHERFTLRFSSDVALANASSAVRIVSVSCPPGLLAPGCAHDVALNLAYQGTDRTRVTVSNPDDAFLPGCRYELRIDPAPLSDRGGCLPQTSKLAFFSLAESDGTALQYEASHLRRDPRNGRIAAYTVKPGIVWQADEFFRERLTTLGLREGIDGFVQTNAARPSGLRRGTESLFFRQTVDAVPVDAHGYTVHREAVGGRLTQFTGRVMLNVPRPLAPAFSEAQTLARAQAEVPGVSTISPPGELLLVPSYANPSLGFRLGRRYTLRDVLGTTHRLVDVDTANLTILASSAAARDAGACTSIDVSTLVEPEPMTLVTAVELETAQSSLGYADATTLYVTDFQHANGTPAHALATLGGEPVSGVPLGRPAVHTLCAGETFPNVVSLPSNRSSTGDWTPVTKVAADVQLAVEACVHFFANRPKPYQGDGVQWSGWDGAGLVPIRIQLDETVEPDNAYYQDGTDPYILLSPDFVGGAQIDILCHEFAHGIWDHLRLDHPNPESIWLEESFSDIFGSAAEYARRHDDASLWCLWDDLTESTPCLRRLDDPTLSRAVQPKVYQGDNWCEEPACPRHQNGGVLSRWFYLLVHGSAAAEGGACGYAVAPLGTTRETSIDRVTEILFVAAREKLYQQGGGFVDMANATLTAVRELYGPSPISESVMAAWHAVGVWKDILEDSDPHLRPQRQAVDVPAWGGLQWELPIAAEESDIQLDVLPTFDGQTNGPLLAQTVPTRQVPGASDPLRATDTIASLDIALEPETTYYWRARSAGGADWGCHAVHSFTTGERPTVTSLRSPADLTQGVPAGELRVQPQQIPGATSYIVRLSTTENGCESGPGVEEWTLPQVADEAEQGEAVFEELLPDTQYYVSVLAVGPDDIGGGPAAGGCFEVPFQTIDLMAPRLQFPPQDAIFNYPDLTNVVLRFETPPGTIRSVIKLYEIDEYGDCELEPTDTIEVQPSCVGSALGCVEEVSADRFARPNPTGYCWEVEAFFAGRDQGISSEPRRMRFQLDPVRLLGPGVDSSIGDPGPLPGNSWEQSVLFEWADEGAFVYELVVGRYPWTRRDWPFAPTAETHRSLVSGTSLSVHGAVTARGRYCWDAYARYEDPDRPGEVWSRQPLGYGNAPNCYTSGPAEPVIRLEQPADDTIYALESVKGTIELSYIPDAQMRITLSHGQLAGAFDLSHCTQSQGVFADVKDCVIPFDTKGVALPAPGSVLQFWVQLFNDPRPVPPGSAPLFDPAFLVHDVPSRPITILDCGAEGEPCCAANECDIPGLACNRNKVCEACGFENGACCDEPLGDGGFDPLCRADQGSDICLHGKCVQCGRDGEPCCRPEALTDRCFNDGVCRTAGTEMLCDAPDKLPAPVVVFTPRCTTATPILIFKQVSGAAQYEWEIDSVVVGNQNNALQSRRLAGITHVSALASNNLCSGKNVAELDVGRPLRTSQQDDWFRYRIRAISTTGVEGDWSNYGLWFYKTPPAGVPLDCTLSRFGACPI
jgi:hypothetical protein